ncbi:MAG: helix-turn-helix domain-containing protein [Candidatus Binataceae bacterium]
MSAARSNSGLYRLLARVVRRPERESDLLGRCTLIGDISRVIGIIATSRLAEDFGGRRVYIPNKPSTRDQITRSIGVGAAVRLSRLYGGDRVMIPAHPDRALRRAQIIALRARGLSVSRIARKLGCTERYVYKVFSAKKTRLNC